MSDDGRHGLTVIALIGSVFSPYYAWSGRRDPLNHCAFNVALYGAGGHRWAMTERPRGALKCSQSKLSIGPSAITWDGTALTLAIDEVTAPLPSRIRGTVRITPPALNRRQFTLDLAGRHRWRPIAPQARVAVSLNTPALAWSGSAYVDTNSGDEPLEHAFTRWDWSRAHVGADTAVLYDVTHRNGAQTSIAVRFAPEGTSQDFPPPPRVPLANTLWRVKRGTQSDGDAKVVETLEDAPFYVRSVIAAHLLGQPVTAMHESLDLDRFATNWVKCLLPFRMPRAPR